MIRWTGTRSNSQLVTALFEGFMVLCIFRTIALLQFIRVISSSSVKDSASFWSIKIFR